MPYPISSTADVYDALALKTCVAMSGRSWAALPSQEVLRQIQAYIEKFTQEHAASGAPYEGRRTQ